MNPIKILYIDDEEHNLKSFKASFRRQYEIYTAISGTEAKNILSQTDIHIIISDQRMPEMTGVEFFKSIKNSYPDPIRVLLTGYTDIDALGEAVNEGHIYRYLTKPWNELELNNCIINAHNSYTSKVALKEKVDELQKTNDELTRFIYSISHELRAPLASALGVIQLVKLENLIDPQSHLGEYWALIEGCCDKLEYNINKTLQYYKNHRYQTLNEKVDFKTLINELIALHKQANNVTDQIAFSLNVNQSVDFWGDSFRIEIILGNLISNAIKYQKPSSVDKEINVSVKVTPLDAQIIIADNGMGIFKEHLPKIYTQFFKGKHEPGAGLGLFIVKEALDKIEGTINVKSDIDEGSIFTIRIPNKNPNHQQPH